MNLDLFSVHDIWNVLYMGKFLRDSQNICTIKAFQMMKFERRDDSKLHLYIGFW